MATLLQNILKIVRYLPTIDEHPRYEIKEEEEEEEKKKITHSEIVPPPPPVEHHGY